MQPARYLKIVRLSAWYDLVVTAGFATPWTFMLLHGVLSTLAQQSGLPGEVPPFAPAHVLMANLLGSVVVVWSLLRLHATQVLHGRYDALARFLFAACQLYAVAHGASWLILGFTAVELAFGIAQLLPVAMEKQGEERLKQAA
ncbi:hypothetical protein [Massilia sp. YIM B02443]|uniref:hypothetical protein n=1 Tax=Massilia sp. YIM B02443 TaxID=3050127 RepID=UPI0025B658FA|nr:hypothetical protein [Massilia sp. YIM B02443]MDN4035412.1 hypothetical protein [Massilia sp. YIM B02443]